MFLKYHRLMLDLCLHIKRIVKEIIFSLKHYEILYDKFNYISIIYNFLI